MPTQRNTLNSAGNWNKGSLRLSHGMPNTISVLAKKYSAEKTITAASKGAAPSQPTLAMLDSAICSSEPVATMASAAEAGLKSRLVQRLDVRQVPTPASAAATTAAAAGPCISSTRKMKISPTMNEFLVPGTRTGNKPAPMVKASPAAICTQASQGMAATAAKLKASADNPVPTTAHQNSVALRL